jgi:hypothetical protein
MEDPRKLRELADWYREYAERAGNPVIWHGRLLTAEYFEREADRLENIAANRISPQSRIAFKCAPAACIETGVSSSAARRLSLARYASAAAWLASLGVKNADLSNFAGSARSSVDSSVNVIPSPPRGPVLRRIIRLTRSK